jgi:hypothetical protein
LEFTLEQEQLVDHDFQKRLVQGQSSHFLGYFSGQPLFIVVRKINKLSIKNGHLRYDLGYREFFKLLRYDGDVLEI